MPLETTNLSLLCKMVLGFYLLALLGYALWMGNSLPYHNDILVYVYPERAFNSENLRSGLIPLWNPFLSCGVPHLANWQSAFFYPPYWSLNLLGLPQGLVWLALLHEAWAFAGFFFWAKSQKSSDGIAALCALSFAGSAHFIRCWINLPFIATASWIPWVFLTVHRALERRKPAESLPALAALSLQLLAGYPIFVLYTWAVLFLWLVFDRRPLRELLHAALLAALALALTAFQWLPFLEFLAYSGYGQWKVFPYYTHPWEYLTLLDPTALGVPDSSGYRSDSTNALFGNLYFGLVPFLLWVLSFIWKRRDRGFWTWSPLFLLLWMAAPSFLKGVPEKSLDFLDPSKALNLFLFALGTGLGRFLSNPRIPAGPAPRRAWWVWFLAALWVLDLGLLPFRLIYRVPNLYQDPNLAHQAEEIRKAADGKRVLALSTSSQMSFSGSKIDEQLQKKMAGIFVDNFLPNTNVVWGLRVPTAYFSLQTKTFTDITRYLNRGFPYRGDLLDIAGVRAFLLPQPLPTPKYRRGESLGANFLSLDPQASADMRWVGEAVELPNRAAVLDMVAEPRSRWQSRVYLEKGGAELLTELPPAARPLAAAPVTGSIRPKPGWASEQGDFPAPGYLVFNDSFAPGWHAWVDGHPAPILRAYGLFMAVAVQAGRHQVDFRYEPATFRLGLFISLLALAAFLASFFKAVPRHLDLKHLS